MRLIFISDTHGEIPDVPDGDVLIHCGDATMMGRRKEVENFNDWLGTLPHKNKLFIPGNHDFLFEENWKEAKDIMTNAICLKDEGLNINGIKFWGTPWCSRFGDWAFMHSEEGLKNEFSKIPEDTDILITHGPPNGILDKVVRGGWHVGSRALIEAIKRVKPEIVSFGHIHEGYGIIEQDGIKYINASICDVNYEPNNNPVIVDI